MKQTRVMLNFNEKGGVGKTTVTGMESVILANAGKKVLDFDLDPQHNLTSMMASTYQDGKNFHPAAPSYKAIENNDLASAICKVSNNIDIIPSNVFLYRFQDWDNDIGKSVRYRIIKETLKPYMGKYDYIFLDVPPTFNPFSLNALYACTNMTLIIMTQRSSYSSALDTVSMLKMLHDKYKFPINLDGVVLYLMINAREDKNIQSEAKKTFGNYVYDSTIQYQERVKGFTDTGVRDKDYWDKRAIGMYKKLTDEVLSRIEG